MQPPGKFRLTYVLTPSMSRRKAARITLAIGGGAFLGDQERALSRRYLDIMLECLTRIDIEYLRANPHTPRLIDAGMLYREEPPGQEDWQDVPTCLLMGIADCVPAETLLFARGSTPLPISRLIPGDVVYDGTGWTKVKAVVESGLKKNLRLSFSSGYVLRCTPQHRLFLIDGSEVRAASIEVGQILLVPKDLPPAVVTKIVFESEDVRCVDIETESGKFFIPSAGVIVHNCEDLAAWLAAERTVKDGIPSMAVWRDFQQPDGSTLFHIIVERSDGVIEDPSAMYGMR